MPNIFKGRQCFIVNLERIVLISTVWEEEEGLLTIDMASNGPQFKLYGQWEDKRIGWPAAPKRRRGFSTVLLSPSPRFFAH